MSFQLLKSFSPLKSEYSKADLEALGTFVLSAEKVRTPVELTLELTAHTRIRALNRRFRGVDRTTDVISFRYEATPEPSPGLRPPSPSLGRGLKKLPSPYGGRGAGGEGFSGDIAINIPQARLQAKKMHHSPRREIRLLWIHGILHLLGYTDYQPRPRRRMFKRQNELLRRWESRSR